MSGSRLHVLQERYAADIDTALQRWLTDRVYPEGFRGMLAYHLGFADERLRPVRVPAGKRFRPILCLVATEAVGGEWQEAIDLAAAIEFLHNFSLIHDDIEDRDPWRHHRPTVWKLWGDAQAINVGDAMFALAGRAASHAAADSSRAWELLEAFQDTTLALTQGQYLDMSFESREDVSSAEYQEMVGLKTGALISFSLWSGGAMAGAEVSALEALLAAGLNLGIAFQAHDDIRGIWADQQETGKVAGKDLENRKRSLPVLLALEQADSHGRAMLADFLGRRSDDVSAVMSVLTETGARRRSHAVVERALTRAEDAFDRIPGNQEARRELIELARELVS